MVRVFFCLFVDGGLGRNYFKTNFKLDRKLHRGTNGDRAPWSLNTVCGAEEGEVTRDKAPSIFERRQEEGETKTGDKVHMCKKWSGRADLKSNAREHV